MLKVDMFDLHNKLKSQNILICFSGRFSQGIIEELGSALKKYMEREEQSSSGIFNVLSIFIEQSQNIRNYTSSKEGKPFYDDIANSSVVIIGKDGQGYFVCSGNIICNDARDKLVEKLELINRLDKVELKKLYKDSMKKELPPDSVGAGLGLIDMARKGNLPIDYTIRELNSDLSFFTLTVTV